MNPSAVTTPSPCSTERCENGVTASAILPDGYCNDAVAKAYAHCTEIVRRRARNFYHGLKLTPEPRRSAIYSIYAWMREGDDAVDADAPLPQRRESLAKFRNSTERLLHGWMPLDASSPTWLALAATLAAYPVDSQILRDMIAGLEEDLDDAGYRTDADLSLYCYRVAGTAGLACMSIWGYREELSDADVLRGRELALRLGQAFQRTNILRDFAEDLHASPRRVYLPTEVFERHGLTSDDLLAWSSPPRCEALVREQAEIAREHYIAGEELQSMVDPTCRPTLWAMTQIYSSILALIEAEPSRVVGDKRIRLSGPRKVGIALRAAASAKLKRGRT